MRPAYYMLMEVRRKGIFVILKLPELTGFGLLDL